MALVSVLLCMDAATGNNPVSYDDGMENPTEQVNQERVQFPVLGSGSFI